MHLTVASHVIFDSVKLVFKRNFNDQQVHLLDESQITGSNFKQEGSPCVLIKVEIKTINELIISNKADHWLCYL